MSPELILLLVGGLTASGLGMWWMRRGQTAHVNQVRTAWVRAGQIVHHGPVGATCLGSRPKSIYGGGVFGALGLTDGRLVFDGHRNNTCNLSLPLEQIQYIGLTTVPIIVGRAVARKRVLTIHHESADGWRVAVLLMQTPVEFANALAALCDCTIHDTGRQREDHGPASATRMIQTIYGEWDADRDGELYLAPDRVLFNWRDAIPLDRIHRLDVLEQPSANPLAADLLRVEYTTPDDADYETDVTGFLVRRADKWADAIAARAPHSVPVQTGRKKKDD
jgi:hypothetical protein